MRHHLLQSAAFVRAARRLLKKNPEAAPPLWIVTGFSGILGALPEPLPSGASGESDDSPASGANLAG
jgi:hypothetical protein